MSGIDVPLDAPIPTTASLYFWWEPDGVWVSRTDYYFLLARRTPVGSERAADGRLNRPPAARQQTFSNTWRNHPYASGT